MSTVRLPIPSSTVWPLPVKLLSAALVLTISLLAALGWFVSAAYTSAGRAHTAHDQLEASCVRIEYLDEVLTMSAHVAAATGDEWWEHRYRRSEMQLRAAVQAASGLVPEPFMGPDAARADAASIELRAMEAHTFGLVRQGDRSAATAVLHSEGYKKQREMCTRARGAVTAQARRLLRSAAQIQRRKAERALISAGVVLGLLVFTWLGVTKMTKTYIAQRRQSEEALQREREKLEGWVAERTEELRLANNGLRAEIGERTRAEEALQEAHAELEGRVKERTAELSETNTHPCRKLRPLGAPYACAHFLKHSAPPSMIRREPSSLPSVNV